MTEPMRVGKHYNIHLYRGETSYGTTIEPDQAKEIVDKINGFDRMVARLQEVIESHKDAQQPFLRYPTLISQPMVNAKQILDLSKADGMWSYSSADG